MGIKKQIEKAQELLEGFEVPLLPEAALKLQKLFNESAMPSPKKVKDLIAMNPFLAGELVSLANIPSLSNTVGIIIKDLDSAIYRLGNKRLKNYILSIYVKKIISEYQVNGLSYHSQDIALIASQIARFNKYVSPDEAYLLGLLHDIGGFALTEIDPHYGDDFIKNQFKYLSMSKYEEATFGTTHAALGYLIAQSWNVPNYISQTILLHHIHSIDLIENTKLRSLISTIELAHSISNIKNHKNKASGEAKNIYEKCKHILDISDDELYEILQAS
ncbi:MAG: hypothetical protein ISEC1_P1523 [Thiomicrorhabdus sp.]|nr:MAG: hypothetical protein ISEC1_P1523 [Thiomicrorhabdus sp.]